jgi:hypothetical protein
MDERELREIRQAARRQRLTVSEWVRQALRTARRREPRQGREEKIAAIRAAACHRFPAPEIEEILAEIESGYLDGRHG